MLGQLEVSAIGLGCMPMSWAYNVGEADPAEIEATLHRAVDVGITLMDTADVYGPFTNEEIIREYVVRGGLRDRVVIATKGGLVPIDATTYGRDGSAAHIRAACGASLQRLGVDTIDLYQLHRVDPEVPLEETWGAMADLVTYRNIVADSERWHRFEQRPGDIVISTPPKSGTTWTQMLCALMIFDGPAFPAKLDAISPWLDMRIRSEDEVFAMYDRQTHRRFIKTHTPLDGLPLRDDVHYVVVGRDPRDVMVSWEHHMANMDLGVLFQDRSDAIGLDDLADFEPPPPPDPVFAVALPPPLPPPLPAPPPPPGPPEL